MRNPDPLTFLDLRPLGTESDPATFMSEWVAAMIPRSAADKRPGLQRQSAWLASLAERIPKAHDLQTRDPATLYVVGIAAGDAELRRAMVRYLLAVEGATADALEAAGQTPPRFLEEIHAATAPLEREPVHGA